MQSLDAHPRLTVSGARIRQAEADVDLAVAEKRPDLMVNLAYQRRDPEFGDMVSAGVTVSLPLFARRRQDPIIAARTAATQAALAGQEIVRRELLAELQAGLAAHAMRLEQLKRARNTLLPLARQRSAFETASYAAGRATLTQVIEARTGLAQAQLAVIDREAAFAREAARLVLAYGETR